MKIFWLAVICLLIGVIVGNRMTNDGSLPGCKTPAPATSSK